MIYNETGMPMQLASLWSTDIPSRFRKPDALHLHQSSSPRISTQLNPAGVYSKSSFPTSFSVVNSPDEKRTASLQFHRCSSKTSPKTAPPPQMSCQGHPTKAPALKAAENDSVLARVRLCEDDGRICKEQHSSELTSHAVQASKVSSRPGGDAISLSDGRQIAIPMLARLACDVPTWIEAPVDTLAGVQSSVCDTVISLKSSATSRPHDYDHKALSCTGDATTSSRPLLFMKPLGLQKVASQEGRANSFRTFTEDSLSECHVDPWTCRYLLPAGSESKDSLNTRDGTSSNSVYVALQQPKDVSLQCNEWTGSAEYSRSMLELGSTVQMRALEKNDLYDKVLPSVNCSGAHSRCVLERLEVVQKRFAANRDLYDMVEKLCPQKVKRADSDTDAPATSDSEAISGISGDEDESTKPFSIPPTSTFIQ